jgi:UDP-N-acetylmuramoyl-tripeptide--D-alanyl-D-alanine ligase
LRLEVTLKGGIHFINDSYNASEPSMLSALKTLGSFPLNQQGRKIAILGQMRELGVFSQGCHERVGEASAAQADIIFCLGEEAVPIFDVCKKKNKPVFWTLSFEELMNEVMKAVRPGDAVLLKGSKSNQLWRVLDYFNAECDS